MINNKENKWNGAVEGFDYNPCCGCRKPVYITEMGRAWKPESLSDHPVVIDNRFWGIDEVFSLSFCQPCAEKHKVAIKKEREGVPDLSGTIPKH